MVEFSYMWILVFIIKFRNVSGTRSIWSQQKKKRRLRETNTTHNDKDVAETNGGNKKGVDLQIGVADF